MSRRLNLISNNSNQILSNSIDNLITTNKDDIIAENTIKQTNTLNTPLVPLIKDNETNETTLNNQSNINNNQNNLNPFSSPFNTPLYGGYGIYPYGGMFMSNMGDQNTFFNKLFMTFERANYQMIHLCEMIKMIQNQLPTIRYFKTLIKKAYLIIIKKLYIYIESIKKYIQYIKNTLSYRNQSESLEELKKQINTINLILKIIFIFSISIVILLKFY